MKVTNARTNHYFFFIICTLHGEFSQPKTHLPGVLLTAFEKMARTGKKKVQLLGTLLTLHGGYHAKVSFTDCLACKGSRMPLCMTATKISN